MLAVQMSKQEKRRWNITNELIKTEETYVQIIDTVCQHFKGCACQTVQCHVLSTQTDPRISVAVVVRSVTTTKWRDDR